MGKTSIQNAKYKNYKDISAPDCQSFFGKNKKKSGSPFHFMIDISIEENYADRHWKKSV